MKRLLFVGIVLFAVEAAAQDGDFELRLRNKVLAGGQRPAVVVIARRDLRNLKLRLRRSDGRRLNFSASLVRAGDQKVFEFRQKVGRYTYTGRVTYKGLDRPVEVSFDCLVARPLRMIVVQSGVDLDHGVIRFEANRWIATAKVKLLGKDGSLLYEGNAKPAPLVVTSHPKGFKPYKVAFPAPRAPVGMAQLQVFDQDGFYTGVQMEPFFVEIPHQEVEFDFGKWGIRPDQEPKLEQTLASIHEALKKLRKDFTVNLYIAGYTDTVGSDRDNLKLSENRARAIARWFVRHGVRIPVYYQGFGERVLRVATPDNTPESRNRRAVYVLAAQAPGPDRNFPAGGHWRRVK